MVSDRFLPVGVVEFLGMKSLSKVVGVPQARPLFTSSPAP